jgi:hypothetical protein
MLELSIGFGISLGISRDDCMRYASIVNYFLNSKIMILRIYARNKLMRCMMN